MSAHRSRRRSRNAGRRAGRRGPVRVAAADCSDTAVVQYEGTPLSLEEIERVYALDAPADQVPPITASPAERKIVKRLVV